MRWRIVTILLTASALLAVLSFLALGEWLSRPIQHAVGAPPAGLAAHPITIPVPAKHPVAGWWATGRPGVGAVLLLHGIRSDRLQMVDRAQWLASLGYAVVLIDLPAHGESVGDRITFGQQEGLAVHAALAWIRQQWPDEKVGVIGVSLGAASFMLAPDTAGVDVVVLESMFPTLEEAVSNRLIIRLGAAGPFLAAPLLWQLPLRIGIHAEDIRPIAQLPQLHAPVLIASGNADKHTTAAETQRIFEAAREPKQLWLVPGAQHVDLFAYDTDAYKAHVQPFLARYLAQ